MAQQKIKDKQSHKNKDGTRCIIVSNDNNNSYSMNSILNRQGFFVVLTVADNSNCYFVSLLKAVEQNFKNAISSNNSFVLQRICAPISNLGLPFFYKDNL